MSRDNVNNVSVPSEIDEQVRRDYMSSLSELTFNSKPIINTLTIIAGENPGFAITFVKAIKEHFSKTKHKLPALYLIDSICKNHGSEYVSYFLPCVADMFIDGYKYSLSDEFTKNAFLKVLQTWKLVFPEETIKTIENGIRSTRKSTRDAVKDQSIQINRSQHISNIHKQSNASTSRIREREYRRNLNESNDLPAYARNDPQYLEQRQQRSLRSPIRHTEDDISNHKRKRTRKDVHSQSQRSDHPPSNPIELLNQLQSLLEGDRTKSATNDQSLKSQLIPQDDIPQVDLTIQGIQKRILNPSHYLYDRLGLQCQQCGLRFSKSSRLIFDNHLDSHFKQNKKLTEKGAHILCRTWFLSEKDWTISIPSSKDENTENQSTTAFFGERSSSHTKQMIIPSSKLSKEHSTCRICNEPFKTVFDSVLDDWVLCEATMLRDDTESFIVHTYCKEDHDA